MEGKKFRFEFTELGLTVGGVEEVIGFNEGEDREFMKSVISDILDDCSKIADVKAEYRIFDAIYPDSLNRRISIREVPFNVEKIVFSQLRKSEMAAMFLCTAGPGPGQKSRKFMNERDLLTGYIYDVIGSEIVEAAADLMQNELERSAAEEGLNITNRYSPGYCGWNVEEQHKLFTLLPGNFCGINLTPSALMDPEKSVSGIIGIGKNVKMNPYTCRICEMKDCIYRRLRDGKQAKL
ncbi:MAG TPA: vitamin B12 dependent-methionine synthase activation domain-containing protein [Bacteroidales bacterium]|nr:vitamin B12 dependent-methionine synthase activation domain-containing protein [Bacteroidales bacterium]